jgi:hypothetical protein
VADFSEIKVEILKHGDRVEVIKPKSLRNLIRTEAKKITQIYRLRFSAATTLRVGPPRAIVCRNGMLYHEEVNTLKRGDKDGSCRKKSQS